LFLGLVAGLRRAQMAVGSVVGTGTDNTGMHPHLRLADNHPDPASPRPKA